VTRAFFLPGHVTESEISADKKKACQGES